MARARRLIRNQHRRSRSPQRGDGYRQNPQNQDDRRRDRNGPDDSYLSHYLQRHDQSRDVERCNNGHQSNQRCPDQHHREGERGAEQFSLSTASNQGSRTDLPGPSNRPWQESSRYDRRDNHQGYDGRENHAHHHDAPQALNVQQRSNSRGYIGQPASFSSISEPLPPWRRFPESYPPSAPSHLFRDLFQLVPSQNDASVSSDSVDVGMKRAPRGKKKKHAAKISENRPPKPQKDVSPFIPSPTAPVPSAAYLEKASELSHRLQSPADLLVILDLNGTLLFRKGKNAQGSSAPHLRPGLREFLAYLFSNFKVMIWTSARPENALRMVRATFKEQEESQLLAIWGRDTLGLTDAQYNANVQVYKTLERVWQGEFMIYHPNLPDQIVFDQTNTVLFDDSTVKATSHPFNLVHIPEYTATRTQKKRDVALRQCIEYLEDVKWQSNVSAYMRLHPFVYAAPAAPKKEEQNTAMLAKERERSVEEEE